MKKHIYLLLLSTFVLFFGASCTNNQTGYGNQFTLKASLIDNMSISVHTGGMPRHYGMPPRPCGPQFGGPPPGYRGPGIHPGGPIHSVCGTAHVGRPCPAQQFRGGPPPGYRGGPPPGYNPGYLPGGPPPGYHPGGMPPGYRGPGSNRRLGGAQWR